MKERNLEVVQWIYQRGTGCFFAKGNAQCLEKREKGYILNCRNLQNSFRERQLYEKNRLGRRNRSRIDRNVL